MRLLSQGNLDVLLYFMSWFVQALTVVKHEPSHDIGLCLCFGVSHSTKDEKVI